MNFEYVGTWWTNKDIQLVKIDNKVYALDGWNGEVYLNCWECTGESYKDAGKEIYKITPIMEEIEEDEWEIVGYEIE